MFLSNPIQFSVKNPDTIQEIFDSLNSQAHNPEGWAHAFRAHHQAACLINVDKNLAQ